MFSELFRVYPGIAISHRRKEHLSILFPLVSWGVNSLSFSGCILAWPSVTEERHIWASCFPQQRSLQGAGGVCVTRSLIVTVSHLPCTWQICLRGPRSRFQWKGYFFFYAKCQNLSCTPCRQQSCLPNGLVWCGLAEFRAVKSSFQLTRKMWGLRCFVVS